MKKEILRKVISFFLSFVAAFCLFASAVSLCAAVALSEPFISAVATSDKFSDAAEEEILFELRALSGPGGLKDDFWDDGLDEKMLKSDIKAAVSAAYSGEKFSADAFIEQTRERIYEFAKGEGINVETKEVEAGIEQLLSHFASAYGVFVNSDVIRALGQIGSAVWPAFFLIALFAALLAVLLISVVHNINKENDKLYQTSIFYGSSVMAALLPVILLLSGSVANLAITSECLYFLTTSVLYALLWGLVVIALLSAAGITIKIKLSS